MDKPIIVSLLDTDFYKFTMGQVVFNKFKDVQVKYVFKNRSKVNLSNFITEYHLRQQLDHVMSLKLNNNEICYLRGLKIFSEDYLSFLSNLHLPSYNLMYGDDGLSLEFVGPWNSAIYWETFALSIVNELYYRSSIVNRSLGSNFNQDIKSTGIINLSNKINILTNNKDITFTDFGTRRRYSQEWQEYVVNTIKNEISSEQFRGTSNAYLAMKYGLSPIGTSAHEMFMILAGISDQSDDGIKDSHNKFLSLWWDQYGYDLSIALTDTFGSKFFFQDMSASQANKWKGLRHDSGDPIEFGENVIKFYRSHGIDPIDKMIVFSDGLDITNIMNINNHFKGKIKTTFGWGTNLTNDLGIKALSLVIKPLIANGNNLVKLSDNLSKAMGDQATVERYKQIFGYDNIQNAECRY